MNENYIYQKDDNPNKKKVQTKNLNISLNASKKGNQKNVNPINKVSTLNSKNQNIQMEENIFSKNKKCLDNSPTQISTLNNIKISKTFNKNNSNNSMKTMLSKQKKLKISFTFNEITNAHNITSSKNKKSLNLNNSKNDNDTSMNNKNKATDENKNIKSNSKKLKINTIVNPKINRSKESKKRDKEKKITKDINDIYNFITDECDESINENTINPNSRKHYSLTNPSILPCIPFSNPFNNQNNNNNNITDINEKNDKHVKSMNINNKIYDMKKNQLLMEKNYLENIDIINVFHDKESNEETEKENEENMELNISNLEIDLNQIDQDLEEKNNTKQNYKKSSFIQFNNNLSLKLAKEKLNNTPSYILALCPKLLLTKNKKDLIKENYAVNEPISEEVDSDSKTPRNSKYKITLEENITKYTTKDKNSDRYKKFIDDSIENSCEEVYKKSNENKNSKNKNMKKNKNKKNFEADKKSNISKKRDKIRKNINLDNIHIETENINNNNAYKESKILKAKKDNYTFPKNISSHYSNNTINNFIYTETESNVIKKKNRKNQKLHNPENNEKHQKAKSLLPDISLSTLYLYETIQNNSTTINNSYYKNKKIMKINAKPNNYRNKILNKEKKDLENLKFKEIKIESKPNNNYNTNRNNHKENEDKNVFHSTYSNKNTNSNKNQLKKKVEGQTIKSPNNKINPFLSNFNEIKEKLSYNNDLNLTMNNNEFKYKKYFDLLKKGNNKKIFFTLNTKKESSKNIMKSSNNILHNKNISQKFIDEYNFLLDLKTDNNKIKLSAQNSKNYFVSNTNNKNNVNKDNSFINNKSSTFKNKLNNEKSNTNLNKNNLIIPCHKKCKTFFISPSYVFKKNNNINTKKSQRFYKRISNNIKDNKQSINTKEFDTTIQVKNGCELNNKNKKINCNSGKKSKDKKQQFIRYENRKGNNYVIKRKNKFKEIKKNIGENTFAKLFHKKTNTFGNANTFSFLCQNLFNYNHLIQNNNQNIFSNNNSIRNSKCINNNNQHKKSASINNLINNLDNKKKIICAMQRIKFIPISNYSKVIKEMTQINNNLLVIYVYKDENQRYVFRGLYQVSKNEPQLAKKIFGPNNEQNILNVNNINNYFNYSLTRGDFLKYKFYDEKNKKFNEDIVMIF